MYGNASVLATICLEKSVAPSSFEAKYTAISDAGRTIEWRQDELNVIGNNQNCRQNHHDKTGANETAKRDPAKHTSERKDVDIKHNYVTELGRTRTVNLVGTRSTKM